MPIPTGPAGRPAYRRICRVSSRKVLPPASFGPSSEQVEQTGLCCEVHRRLARRQGEGAPLAACLEGILEGEGECDHVGIERLVGADGPGEVAAMYGDVEDPHLE